MRSADANMLHVIGGGRGGGGSWCLTCGYDGWRSRILYETIKHCVALQISATDPVAQGGWMRDQPPRLFARLLSGLVAPEQRDAASRCFNHLASLAVGLKIVGGQTRRSRPRFCSAAAALESINGRPDHVTTSIALCRLL